MTKENEINENVVRMNEQGELANEAADGVLKAVKITDDDKVKGKVKSKKAKELKDEEFAKILQDDLSTFISDKIDLNVGQEDIEKLSTGIDLLDTVMGGGFGLGTFSLIVGMPGTFKSALLAQMIGQVQKDYNGKLLATYHDSESAMTSTRLAQLGVTNPRLTPYDDVTIESVFKTIEAMAAFKKVRDYNYPAIVAWDSIANTSTEKERTTDDITKTIGLKARLLSALFPRYVMKMKENKITMIAINQLREKLDMGMFGSANDLKWMGDKVIPGGQAVKFNAFHLLYLKSKFDLKPEMYGFGGVKLELKCIKNKFFRPNIPIELVVDFNRGVSNFWTNYNFLATQKIIQPGAWNKLITMPEKKFRTKDAENIYNDNEDGFKIAFDKAVKETIQKQIIEPNS